MGRIVIVTGAWRDLFDAIRCFGRIEINGFPAWPYNGDIAVRTTQLYASYVGLDLILTICYNVYILLARVILMIEEWPPCWRDREFAQTCNIPYVTYIRD